MLWHSLLVLTAKSYLCPVQEPEAVKAAQSRCKKLYLCHRARDGEEIAFLASPLTGGGIAVGRFLQLFLLARHAGRKQPSSEWALFVWEILSSQGQRLVKEGKTLETPEENIAELTAQAKVGAEKQLPILKTLGID